MRYMHEADEYELKIIIAVRMVTQNAQMHCLRVWRTYSQGIGHTSIIKQSTRKQMNGARLDCKDTLQSGWRHFHISSFIPICIYRVLYAIHLNVCIYKRYIP